MGVERQESLGLNQPTGKEQISLVKELWQTKCWRLFPLLTIYVISLTLLMPIKPNLMTDFFASRHADHYIRCESYQPKYQPQVCRDAHSSVVTYSSWSDFFSSSFLVFPLAPLIGKWSDVYGRKPFLMLCFVCASCTIGVLFLNLNFGVSMFFYFPAQAINGALSSVSICMAYVSDKLHPENRAPTFGLIICSFSVGILVGPLGGGYIPPPTASWMALSGILFCVLYVLLLIPESVTPQASQEARERQKATPLHLRGPFQGFAILGRSTLFIKLTICIMISGIVSEGMYELVMQYFQMKLNFDTRDQSHMFLLSGVCGMVVQLLILRLLLRYAGKAGMLLIGLAASTIQQTLMVFVWNKPSALLTMCVGTVGNLAFPAVSSIKSVNVAESEQGAMQGALAGARALAQGFGPLIFAGLFSLFTQSWSSLPYFPGAPFIFGAAMLLFVFILASTINRKQANEGIKGEEREGTLAEPLLPDIEEDEEQGIKQTYGLPEGYMIEHDSSPAILMDMVPDLVCDRALKTQSRRPSAECIGLPSAEEIQQTIAEDRETDSGTEQASSSSQSEDPLPTSQGPQGYKLDLDRGLRNPQNGGNPGALDPRDSARSQHGWFVHHKKGDKNVPHDEK